MNTPVASYNFLILYKPVTNWVPRGFEPPRSSVEMSLVNPNVTRAQQARAFLVLWWAAGI